MQNLPSIYAANLGDVSAPSSHSAPALAVRSSAAIDACLRALDRIEQVVEQETHALTTHAPADLVEFNHRKSHGLLELSRVMRGLDAASSRDVLEDRVQALRGKLQQNEAALRTHRAAVQEVSAIMARAIRDSDSDGTYSAAVRFGERPRC